MSIQEVSDRIDLPKSTLRYWEKEFKGLIAPTRTPGGQRRYSEEDVSIIMSIHRHKQKGFSLTQIKEFLYSKHEVSRSFKSYDIEQLSDRIADTVKREVFKFFQEARDEGMNTFIDEGKE